MSVDSLINSIGGYESWQFATLTFGTLFIGLGLYIIRKYFIPIPLFGIFMVYFYLNHLAQISNANLTPMASGVASTIPIIAVAGLIIVLVSAWDMKPPQKNRKDTGSNNQPEHK